MADRLITEHWWLGALAWAILYACDYLLTVATARRYSGPVGEHLVYERGIELNPLWEAEIAQQRWFSPWFLTVWALTTAILVPTYFVAKALGLLSAYAVLTGALVLVSCAMDARHLSNLISFRAMADPGAMQGAVSYAYWLSLRASGAQLLGMGVILGAIAAVTQSWFVAGGALGCATAGAGSWRRSRREQAKAPGMPPAPPPLVEGEG